MGCFDKKQQRFPAIFFLLIVINMLKKTTDKQLQPLTLQPNSLLHSHSGWSHARWRGACMTPARATTKESRDPPDFIH